MKPTNKEKAAPKKAKAEAKPAQTIPQQIAALSFDQRKKLVDGINLAHQKDVETFSGGQEPDGAGYETITIEE